MNSGIEQVIMERAPAGIQVEGRGRVRFTAVLYNVQKLAHTRGFDMS